MSEGKGFVYCKAMRLLIGTPRSIVICWSNQFMLFLTAYLKSVPINRTLFCRKSFLLPHAHSNGLAIIERPVGQHTVVRSLRLGVYRTVD